MRLSRPLIFLDAEATGVDAARDRLVELALIKISPDEHREEMILRVNPGVKISAEVIAIHGITNEAVADCPTFKEVAGKLLAFLEGGDLAGFGVTRFDVPLLIEEFKRANLQFPSGNPAILDGLTIFHRKQPRDLTAAYQFFCGKTLVGAHGARADALASLEVLEAELKRYPDLPQEVPGLHAYCHKQDERFVDTRGKFFWKDGEAALNFGKHKGVLLRTLAKEQRDYLEWVIHDGKFSQEVVDICWRALRGEFPKKPDEEGAADVARNT
jgi:DNA polymerase III subunit epsilon